MDKLEHNTNPNRRATVAVALLLIALAVAMAYPALSGGFSSGDDHHFVLNHALVNHPSLEHCLKLFTIVHRDLYQPIPMVAFSAQFAIASKLGLFESGQADAGAWVMYLTNLLLHVINTLLVWLVIRKWKAIPNRELLAFFVAALFAVHPFQVEVVFWLSGQMMLISTMFLLTSLLTMSMWIEKPKASTAILVILFVACCGLSKVRLGLPVVMLISAAGCGLRLRSASLKFWILWGVCAVVTGGLVGFNVWTTSQASYFESGAQALQGPPLVRVLLSLGFYIKHIVWPAGLASWYPAPKVVGWTDSATIAAAAICIPTFVALGVMCLRHRVALWGTAWFAATIFSTLPFMPSRNSLAADRYMYVPIIGLLIVIAWAMSIFTAKLVREKSTKVQWWAPRYLVLLLAAILLPVTWHTASFYEGPIEKTGRLAALSPEAPTVWSRLGAAHLSEATDAHERGDNANAQQHFAKAIEFSKKEFEHGDAESKGKAYQVIAKTLQRTGDTNGAIDMYRKSIEEDPASPISCYDLGKLCEEMGRVEEAARWYRESADRSGTFNPSLVRLAKILQQAGRTTEAAALFEQAIENNEYEVQAILGLAELDLADGSVSAYSSAAKRLSELLAWNPNHTQARTTLGIAWASMGMLDEAVEEYEIVVNSGDPEPTAILNLASIYESTNQQEKMQPLMEMAVGLDLQFEDRALFVHDFFEARGRFDRCISLWENHIRHHQESITARCYLAWSQVLAGDIAKGTNAINALSEQTASEPIILAANAYIGLIDQDHDRMLNATRNLCSLKRQSSDVRTRLARAANQYGIANPNDPWTICLFAHLAACQGAVEPMQTMMQDFRKRCQSDNCQACDESLSSMTTP